MKKIVFNTDQIFLHGGIEKVMAVKANYFANLPDVEVYIVTIEQNGKPPCYPLDKKIKLIDLGVNYNRSKSYFSRRNIFKAFYHYKRQKRLFRQLNPDVVISPNYNFDFYWLPFIQRNAKKIKEIHGSRYNWQPTKKNKLNAWFESKYDTVVVLNPDEARYYSSDNVVVIPNPVEISNLQCDLKKKQVVAAGRISPVKAFDELIKAWKQVYEKHPDWQLHIYGENYLNTREQLQKLIEELGLSKVIRFKGSVPDMAQTMLDYSIYAMSSVTECFPMVLLEALSVGLPIVSYDCPNGPRNIITDKADGFLAQHQNPFDLADKIMMLIEDKELLLQMGESAKKNSVRFSTENIMQIWLHLLKG
ncbi:MAG: glycosyltransferase family 4 protein [Flavobacteriaceae bacterium]|jgi:glycosyltransferase involved in cell wall biosynthesis|nr:glycosyltransferase family 4 protein [Flavobacteriaceae bacterium]